MSFPFSGGFMKGKKPPRVRMLEAIEGLGSQQAKIMLTVLIKSSVDKEIAQKTAGTMVLKWHK